MNSDKAIGVAILLYVVAAILPGAFNSIFGANTTGWSSGTIALWGLIPLFVVIFLVRYFSKGDAA